MNRNTLIVSAGTLAMLACTAQADVTVTSRRSYLELESIAASGPETDELRIINPGIEELSLTAPYEEAPFYDAFVLRTVEPVSGSASASASTDRTDSLTYDTSGALTQAAFAWTSAVSAEHHEGGGIATGRVSHNYRLEFTVTEPVRYRLAGSLTADSDAFHEVFLRNENIFTKLVNISSVLGNLGAFDQTGVLPAADYALESDAQVFAQSFSFSVPALETESHDVTATLDMTCIADMDFDADTDPDDLSAFVNAFTDAIPGNADMDGDADEDPDDINSFVNSFIAGCS